MGRSSHYSNATTKKLPTDSKDEQVLAPEKKRGNHGQLFNSAVNSI